MYKSIVCTNLNTHTILLPAAVLTQDVGVLGSVDDASPPGGVDCEPLTPLLISEGGNKHRQLFQTELKLH